MQTALAITHLAFEDPGTLGLELERAGFAVQLLDACTADLRAIDAQAADLLVVMGGPVGVLRSGRLPVP